MKLGLMVFVFTLLFPSLGNSQSYKEEILYPNGEGPFPVVILSHGRGGSIKAYRRKASDMTGNGFAAIVLDHYSARGEYGAKFKKFPKVSESTKWREADILDVLRNLKNNPLINREKVVLAGWSSGAAIVLPIISNPIRINIPEDVTIAGAILTYPYTWGCYSNIESFNVPVIIHFGSLDGSKGNPLTGYHCWKDKVSKFNDNRQKIIFKTYDDAHHLYDRPFLKGRGKSCVKRRFRDGTTEVCRAFNKKAFKQAIIENRKFLEQIRGN